MGWQTINQERVYLYDHYLSNTKSPRRASFDNEALDNFIDSLAHATPQQIKQYVQNNTNDIGEVRVLLAKLAVALAFVMAGGTDK